MNNSEQSKICPQCEEEIKGTARKCPHCHSWQTGWLLFLANPGVSTIIVFAGLALFYFFLFRDMFEGNKDFSKYRTQIQILDLVRSYSEDPKTGPMITTMGRIKNNTDVKWRHVVFEVQYFNNEGKLIDTLSDSQYDFVLIPHEEQTFRIRGAAAKPELEYAGQKVFVRDAEEAGRWP